MNLSEQPWGFGLDGLAYALGGETVEVEHESARYTSNQKRLRGWGYRRFHRATPDTGLTDLAVGAAELALDRAGVAPGDVDLLVFAMADIPEYLYWDPAASIQGRVGAHRAEALLLGQACGAGVMAFDAIAGKFATHPDYRVALLVTGNRVCEQYWNRMDSNTCVSSDGAAAAVATRGLEQCRWLVTETLTDGRYADSFRLDKGGAADPFRFDQQGAAPGSSSGGVDPRVRNPFERLLEFFGSNVAGMYEFVQAIKQRHWTVMERAMKRSGIGTDELRLVLHMHDNLEAFRDLERLWPVELEQTNVELAMEHGHLGTADQLFALRHALDHGRVSTGDHVALTSLGSGMHWSCTLLRI